MTNFSISSDSPITMMTVGQLKAAITECLQNAGKMSNAEPVPETHGYGRSRNTY